MAHCGIISGKAAPTLRRRIFIRSRNDSDRRCCVDTAWTQQRSDDLSARQLYDLEEVMPRSPATTGGDRRGLSRQRAGSGRSTPLSTLFRRWTFPKAAIQNAESSRSLACLLEPLQREERPSTVAQQPFQTGPVQAFDSDRGIQREAPAVVPTGHVLRIGRVESAGRGRTSAVRERAPAASPRRGLRMSARWPGRSGPARPRPTQTPRRSRGSGSGHGHSTRCQSAARSSPRPAAPRSPAGRCAEPRRAPRNRAAGSSAGASGPTTPI